MLLLTECVWEFRRKMHYGILISMPYWEHNLEIRAGDEGTHVPVNYICHFILIKAFCHLPPGVYKS